MFDADFGIHKSSQIVNINIVHYEISRKCLVVSLTHNQKSFCLLYSLSDLSESK